MAAAAAAAEASVAIDLDDKRLEEEVALTQNQLEPHTIRSTKFFSLSLKALDHMVRSVHALQVYHQVMGVALAQPALELTEVPKAFMMVAQSVVESAESLQATAKRFSDEFAMTWHLRKKGMLKPGETIELGEAVADKPVRTQARAGRRNAITEEEEEGDDEDEGAAEGDGPLTPESKARFDMLFS